MNWLSARITFFIIVFIIAILSSCANSMQVRGPVSTTTSHILTRPSLSTVCSNYWRWNIGTLMRAVPPNVFQIRPNSLRYRPFEAWRALLSKASD